MSVAAPVKIRTELRAGDIGRIVALHGEVYDPLPGFGITFEAFVGRTLAEYVLDNKRQGQIWLVEQADRLVGCAALVLRDNARGQIRWVVLHPDCRGKGIGKRIVNDALDYADDNGCTHIFLETTDGLPESQSLYESLGFVETSNDEAELWDGVRPLILMELDLKQRRR